MTSRLTRIPQPLLINVVVLFGSDTALEESNGTPVSDETFMANVQISIDEVRRYYFDQLGGYTFTANPPILYRDARTEAVIAALGTDFFVARSTLEAATDAGLIDLASEREFCLFSTPIDLTFTNAGLWSYFSFTRALPGHAMISHGIWGRLLGGIEPAEYPFGGPGSARGIMGHELGHGLGAGIFPDSAFVPMPHPNELIPPDLDPPSRMMTSASFSFPDCVFSEWEKRHLLWSPFLTFHETRP